MESNKDYRIKVTIRNDRLLTAMENQGFVSVSQFAATNQLNYQRTSEIFNGKLKPINEKGKLKPLAEEILAVLNLDTSDAFTDRQLKGFVRTSFEKRIKEKDLLKIANPIKNHELLIMEKEVNQVLEKIIKDLGPRGEKIVNMMNGLAGSVEHTQKEIGQILGISGGRVGQIYQKCLRKLSHPNNLEKLKNTGMRDIYGMFKKNIKKNIL
jgi:RNA polymerase sigma factor (sigma-70 family)